jgi:hypothetical protein
MRKSVGQAEEAYSPTIQEFPELWEDYTMRPSPDLRPSPLPIPFGTPRKSSPFPVEWYRHLTSALQLMTLLEAFFPASRQTRTRKPAPSVPPGNHPIPRRHSRTSPTRKQRFPPPTFSCPSLCSTPPLHLPAVHRHCSRIPQVHCRRKICTGSTTRVTIRRPLPMRGSRTLGMRGGIGCC